MLDRALEQDADTWAAQFQSHFESCLFSCACYPYRRCDNIFYNANQGIVKIGDLGLATCQQGLSVVGR